MPFRFVLWFWMGYAANNWDKIVPFINKQWPSWPLSSEDTKIAMTYFDEWQEFMNERMHEFYEWNLTNYEEEKKLGWY
jgi:hypothetical protein